MRGIGKSSILFLPLVSCVAAAVAAVVAAAAAAAEFGFAAETGLTAGLALRGGLGVVISSNSLTFTPGGIGNLVRLFGFDIV